MISVTDETGRLSEDQLDWLRGTLVTWLANDGLAAHEDLPLFSLIFTDDQAIAKLNERDRGVNGPTDVLSYPVHEPDDEGFPALPFLGDIFISLDTATQQAEAAGQHPLIELLVLAVHGFTHLQGYDHTTEEEWKVFEAAQEAIRRLALADLSPGHGSGAA